MSTACPVVAFLNGFTNGDREQLALILDDRTRDPMLVAKSLQGIDGPPRPSGVDILRHRHHTCTCFVWCD